MYFFECIGQKPYMTVRKIRLDKQKHISKSI